jgi:hypothetical protein
VPASVADARRRLGLRPPFSWLAPPRPRRPAFGTFDDEPVDLARGQGNAALLQRADQISGLEHPAVGHDLTQMPVIVELGGHHPPFSAEVVGSSAGDALASMVFMQSVLTWV